MADLHSKFKAMFSVNCTVLELYTATENTDCLETMIGQIRKRKQYSILEIK